MGPVCIANAAAMVAGAGSTGGVLAVCISKTKRFFTTDRRGPISENGGEIRWRLPKRLTGSLGRSSSG